MTRVLVVDDDPDIRRVLGLTLRARGYETIVAEDGATALDRAAYVEPDVVVLDLGLPEIDGVAVLSALRTTMRAPIIILSGRADQADKINALDAGADDYVTKPFAIGELLARVRAAARRTSAEPKSELHIGEAAVDLAARTVIRDGSNIRLTPTEWRLFEELLRHPGRLVTQRQLLAAAWGPGVEDKGHYLRLYMARLRGKLEPDPRRPRYLVTEPGVGYRYQP